MDSEETFGGSLMLEQTTKKWTCRRQKLLLTYATHIPKNELCLFLASKCPNPIKYVRCGHEKGKEHRPGTLQYEHTHVVIDWGYGFTWHDARLLDWVYPDEGNWAGKDDTKPPSDGGRRCHPNIRYIRAGDRNWSNVLQYISKEDPENVDLKEANADEWDIKLKDLQTKPDILHFAAKHPEAAFKCPTGIMMLIGETKRQINEDEALASYPPQLRMLNWQREMHNILKDGPPDGRHIIWFWGRDTEGGHGKEGKTIFACWLATNMQALFLNNAGTNNIAYSYDEAKHKIVLFDLTKSSEDRVNYTAMEALKNGAIYSGKYHSNPKVGGTRPWVIVMSNHPPAKDALADDRFWVYNLRTDPWALQLEDDPEGTLIAFNQCDRSGAIFASPLMKIMEKQYL